MNLSPFLGLNTLPNLKYFRGNTHVFLQFALVRPKCLQTSLRHLALTPNGTRHPLTLMEFFTALIPGDWLQSPVAFPALKELSIDLSDWNEIRPQDICGILSWWTRICGPSLEVFQGSLPPVPITSTILGNVFKLFPKLREIHLCEKMIKGDEDPEEESVRDYVANLGNKCPKLERVVVMSHIVRQVIPGGRNVISCSTPKSVHVITR
jgi:hypothetical protein